MDTDRLMQLALNKHAELNRLDAWRAPSAEEKKIVAMAAELESIKDKNLKIVGALKKASRGDRFSSAGGNRNGRRNGGGRGRGRGRGDRRAPYNQNDPEHAWKRDRGAAGADHPDTFVKNGKTYHWCPKHNAWCLHAPADCRLTPEEAEANTAEAGESGGETRTQDRANNAFLAALHAIGEDDDTDIDE